MRGALFIIILIAMLVVGVLVIKDMGTENADETTKKEMIQKAEDTAAAAENALQKITDKAQKALEK